MWNEVVHFISTSCGDGGLLILMRTSPLETPRLGFVRQVLFKVIQFSLTFFGLIRMSSFYGYVKGVGCLDDSIRFDSWSAS